MLFRSEVVTLEPAQRPRFREAASVRRTQLALAARVEGHPGRVE